MDLLRQPAGGRGRPRRALVAGEREPGRAVRTGTSTSPRAVSSTAGLMVLVYAITLGERARLGQRGLTVGLRRDPPPRPRSSAFVGIEAALAGAAAAAARIFRGADVSGGQRDDRLTVGAAAACGQFFLIALYLQQVLRYSTLGDRCRLHRDHRHDHRRPRTSPRR